MAPFHIARATAGPRAVAEVVVTGESATAGSA
jgi:hypothetical protein